MNTFKETGIKGQILEALNRHGIVRPTLVQEKTIPYVLQGRDVVVQSETGSGKTIAFAAPILQLIKPSRRVQSLTIAPTRELAKQVAEEYIKFSRGTGLRTAIVYGGVSIDKQSYAVRQADIVVGTPGRLLDLLGRQMLNLTYCKYLVIDEADRLFDMGFIEDVDDIISHTPQQKQFMMFSATVNSRLLDLIDKYDIATDSLMPNKFPLTEDWQEPEATALPATRW